MSDQAPYPHGCFCWVDLTTRDLEQAERFYHGLFGWSAARRAGGEGADDVEFSLDGRAVAGLGRATDDGGVVWNSYVCVDDARAAEQRVRAAGGQIVRPTTSIGTAGQMNVLRDPEGAMLCTWQPIEHAGARLCNIPNTWGWNELATRDVGRAQRFYHEVFGWGPTGHDDGAEVRLIFNQGREIGHMLRMNEKWGDMPSAWMPYFTVADCNASCARAEALGGGVGVPPTDIPQGRFAVLRDDQGAHFYVIAR